ncbi:uncharacterized protein LOC104001534 [Pan troglodytes]|uniref:uncharacterized protein LOC104001534 n=1 Tax=Pan troglodytes TaxID=9598 RepID=UPI0030136CDA
MGHQIYLDLSRPEKVRQRFANQQRTQFRQSAVTGTLGFHSSEFWARSAHSLPSLTWPQPAPRAPEILDAPANAGWTRRAGFGPRPAAPPPPRAPRVTSTPRTALRWGRPVRRGAAFPAAATLCPSGALSFGRSRFRFLPRPRWLRRMWATRLSGALALPSCSPFQSDGLLVKGRRRSARPFELNGGGHRGVAEASRGRTRTPSGGSRGWRAGSVSRSLADERT